ncbi:MAG: hypothetical protein GTO17_12830 [Candidatus Aminicenantes bacterium]|nr:hypothetical protein [Candidatus Aminicenantes bacterium]
MSKKYIFRFSFIILMAIFLSLSSYPQEKKEDKGEVSIPWDEFRKLLELDIDEVVLSWEEFQKILAQTGKKYIPPFQLKDEKVVLTREQFKRLLDQMKPPVITVVQPPADYLITKAAYQGRITRNNALLQANLSTEIFPKERSQYVKIPLFPMNIALKDVFFDKRPGVVILENNKHTLATSQVGQHQITVDFSLKTDLEKGPRALSFPIPRTPITSLDLDIPFTKIEVEVTNAQQVEVTERAGQTHVFALLSPSNFIGVKWRRKLPEAVKGPAKIYADTLSHISIEDDALRVNTDVSLSVLQNTIPSIILKLPEGYSILNVRGSGLGDWLEVKRRETNYLEIPFDYPKKGNFTVAITAEKLLPNASMAVDFTGFAVEEAIREKGFLGVELKSASEATLSSAEGLDRLDVSELPPVLISRSQKPLLFGFKYLHHPYSLVLDIKKHEELPIISTVVDSASGVTLFTEDGKLVHRLVYKVRNTSKQFLELELPEEAQVWGLFVAGEPAKPRINQNKILIPLNRSRQGATGLVAFDVELIYYLKAKRFGWLGQRDSLFPAPDVIISQMLWSVYLPVGYTFPQFGGSVEKEKKARGIRPLLVTKRRASRSLEPAAGAPEKDKERLRQELDDMKKQFSANLAIAEEQLAEQVENEAQFSQRVQDIQEGKVQAVSGVLPIRIIIPTTGQVFRFAKTLVSEEPLTLSFTYTSRGMMTLVGLLILVIILILLFVFRSKMKKPIGFLPETFRVNYFHLALLILSLVMLLFSNILALICFVGFLLTLLPSFKSKPKKK